MTAGTLKREVSIFGATMIGIGSMVGAFSSVSAGVARPAALLAIVLAAVVATCNALSSAQLAASMPVSGGTYEYGYAYLPPWLGFTAGPALPTLPALRSECMPAAPRTCWSTSFAHQFDRLRCFH